MKSTGIVRRIDELGRVVLPMEIRKKMRFNAGDSLEIFTDQNSTIVLKKYSPIDVMSIVAKEYTESLFGSLGHIACITDKDMIIAASGVGLKDYVGQKISMKLRDAITSKKVLDIKNAPVGQGVQLTTDESSVECHSLMLSPIVVDGESFGAVLLASTKPEITMGAVENKLVQVTALFIENRIGY